MQSRRCRIFPILVLALAPGCQAFYQYRPVVILARDAETQQPIAGATVHVSYPLTNATQAPLDSGGATGKDGIVRLKAAPAGDAGIQLDANATGYLAQEQHLAIEKIKSIPFVPVSHPFVERLIGTVRREFLDHVLIWNAVDLGRNLGEFRNYYNENRVHQSLGGRTRGEKWCR